ncbi:MAG: hypothetical protein MUC69_07760 [Gemmatimonadales bacterium]|nr:hypothetical protein [Gemmatimonadales bacterium]
MRTVVIGLVAGALLWSAPVGAQVPDPDLGPEAALMRQQLEERFGQRVKEELGLDEQQAAKLQTVASGWAVRRRAFEAEQRELKRALSAQMRPGVAAQPDSVQKLVLRLLDLRVSHAESYREEYRELGFLSPVQRAQYVMLRERMLDTLRRVREDRLQRRGPAGPPSGR